MQVQVLLTHSQVQLLQYQPGAQDAGRASVAFLGWAGLGFLACA